MNTSPYNQTKEGLNLVRNMLAPQMRLWVSEQLEITIARMGQRLVSKEDRVLTQAVIDFIDLIIPTVGHYSQEEVEDVLRLGALGELGDNVSMSSRTVSSWFRRYSTEHRPKIAKQHAIDYPEPIVRELPPAELGREYYEREARVAAMEYEPSDIHLIHPRMFDIYAAHGLIDESKLKKHTERAKVEAERERAAEPPAAVSMVAKWATSRGHKESDRVWAWCKRLAVAEYYDWLRVRSMVKAGV